MLFFSTHNPESRISFKEAVFQGLAPDGGLYLPVKTPELTSVFGKFNSSSSFLDIASGITAELFADEMTSDTAERICKRAFTFSPKLNKRKDNLYLLELFHGPSCAFKDFGASFLASAIEEFLKTDHRKAVILTATSGDTGSAVARAFYGKKNIDVVILYPSGRVSPLQEKQLTTLGGNVKALEVKGSFDDCQKMAKDAFVDKNLSEKINLTSANSINLGRLIPQSFYYIWAFSMLKDAGKDIVFCVPSGNFGNLTAGILAWQWGLTVSGFIAATNRNDVVPEYLKTGIFTPRVSVQTYSNAMDVGDPSNFERLTTIFGNSNENMKKIMNQEVITDLETLETIKRVKEKDNIFIDPHTAVGYLSAERFLNKNKNSKKIAVTLATAHPGKFLEVVEKATGIKQELPERLKELLSRPKQSTIIKNELKSLSGFLLSSFK